MFLSNFSVKRPVTVSMVVAGIILFGIISLKKLSVALLPELTYPTITIKTVYEGAAPEEIEELITNPVESAVAVVENVVSVTSQSREGVSFVYVDFKWGTEMNYALLDIREKIEQTVLPESSDKPVILRYNPNFEPVIKAAAYFKNTPPQTGDYYKQKISDLKNYFKEDVAQYIERVPGVASVEVNGGYEKIISIEPEESKLTQYDLRITDIARILEQENVNLTGGEVYDGNLKYTVRTLNEFNDLTDIKNIIVKYDNNVPVFLRNIADVRFNFKDRDKIALLDGRECLDISIYKQGDANTVNVSDNIFKNITFIKNLLPANVKFDIVYNSADFIQQSVNEVKSAALWGGIFAVLILYLFLGNIKSTCFVGISIPVSIIAAFLLLYFNKISLNMISLGGLALGIGMLVDDSIIVLENIFRFKEQGEDNYNASIKGAHDIAAADAASTFTTIAVFLPLIFVAGISGQLFKDMGLTVTYSLLSSLIVSLTVIPMLSAIRRKKSARPVKRTAGQKNIKQYNIFLKYMFIIPNCFFKKLFILLFKLIVIVIKIIFIILKFLYRILAYFLYYIFYFPKKIFDLHFNCIKRIYPALLEFCLNNSFKIILVSVVVFALGLFLLKRINRELFPDMKQTEFFIHCKIPFGSPIEKTLNIMQGITHRLNKIEGIKQVLCNIGSAREPGSQIEREQSNYAKFVVKLNNDYNNSLMTKKSSEIFDSIPGLTYKINKPEYFTFKNPFEIEVIGTDLKKLTDLTGEIFSQISVLKQISNITTSILKGNPELIIKLNRDKCNFLNISIRDVAEKLKNKILGEKATEFKSGYLTMKNKLVTTDIVVRLPVKNRNEIEKINNIHVGTAKGKPVLLNNIADFNIQSGPGEIQHRQQKRVFVISVYPDTSKYKLSEVNSELEKIINKIRQNIPPGYAVEITGQNKEMMESQKDIVFALCLAAILVYMILAGQYESLIAPLIIIICIPFSYLGVIFVLYLTGTPINITVLIGMLMLTGIVVNDAIILVDYIIKIKRSEKYNLKEIIKSGCMLRLRPILMTTYTTVLGMIPMYLSAGAGSELRTGIALTVISGLITSTALTLLIIPLVYYKIYSKI